MSSEYCKHCNIEHPPINGLLSNEIVRESHQFEYRGLEFEIWIIENPNSHWWGWGIPIGQTAKYLDEIRALGLSLFYFEGYYIPSYIYREKALTAKDLALTDTKKGLQEITDTVLDVILGQAEEKIKRLKAIVAGLKKEK